MTEIIIKVDDKFLEVAKAEGMEDQYELIRCKDCRHWRRNPINESSEWGLCFKHKDVALATDRTDWCSWAERKDDATD